MIKKRSLPIRQDTSAMESFPPGARRLPRVPSRSRLCSTWATWCVHSPNSAEWVDEEILFIKLNRGKANTA